MPKLLFISHDFSRTGAPKVLVNLLKDLQFASSSLKIEVLTLRGGPLIHDLSECKYPVTVLEDQNKLYKRIIDRLLSIFIGQKVYKRGDVVLYFERLKRGRANYDIIYANTILSVKMGCMINDKSEGKTKLIAHIHELKTNTKILVPDIYEYYQKVDKFIAVSDLVKEELINEWHISSDRIDVIYPTIPQNFNYTNVSHPSSNIIQIGFAGYVHWNKGYDLFIQVAYNFRKKYPAIPAKFRWIGSIDQDKRLIVEADLKKAGLDDYVFFEGELDDLGMVFPEFDLLLMTSREDSMPLVGIEAGRLGIPIVCFKSASGLAGLVENEKCGIVVDYLDTESMADSIAKYVNNKEQYAEHSKNAQKVFSQFKHNQQDQSIETILNQVINNQS